MAINVKEELELCRQQESERSTLPITRTELALKCESWVRDRTKWDRITKSLNRDVIDVFGLKITKDAVAQAGFLKDGEFDYLKFNDIK